MSEGTLAQRRRGGQPGNKNSKGNRGNSHPRRNFGNRGGSGAAAGNQYARKRARGLHAALLNDYQNNPEARAWIESQREVLAGLAGDATDTDAVDIAIHQGFNPDVIAARGQERRFGLFVSPTCASTPSGWPPKNTVEYHHN